MRPVPDVPSRVTHLCAVPRSLPVDPEGAKAPLPSAAPYYVAEHVVNERLVLARNRSCQGRRPHHVDRIVVDLGADPATAVDEVARGKAEYVWPLSLDLNSELADLARRYGVNKARFFVKPSLAGRMFFLNTSRPLFVNNAKLRQAVNFAVNRKALVREFGSYAATATDEFLPPLMPGFKDERIYSLTGPDLRRARALAGGRTRSGKAVLYIRTSPLDVAAAHVLQTNLRALDIEVKVEQFPTPVLFQRASTPGEPFDIILLGWEAAYGDPRETLQLFDHRELLALQLAQLQPAS